MVFFLIGAVLGAWYAKRYTRDIDRVQHLLSLVQYSIIGVILAYVPFIVLSVLMPTKEIVAGTVTLHDMKVDNAQTDPFFLVAADSNGGWDYRYYIQREDGSIAPRTLSTYLNDVRIIESDDATPRLERFVIDCAPEWSWLVASCERWNGGHYIFTVPKGSVFHQFNL